jgi:hypothetical protein
MRSDRARQNFAPETDQSARACVPVDAHVVGSVVDDLDDDEVAFPREHRRPGELPVHRHDALAATAVCIASEVDLPSSQH